MRGKEIILSGVDKTYQTRTGSVKALSKVSLTIERSSFVSIVGPSGCGKSTLMNHLRYQIQTTDTESVVFICSNDHAKIPKKKLSL